MNDGLDYTAENFWKRVEDLLFIKHISKANLCKMLEIDSGTLSSAIRRKNMPAANTAFKIAKFLGTSVEFLIQGNDVTALGDFSDEPLLKDAFIAIKQSKYLTNIAEALPFLDLKQQQAILTIIKSMKLPVHEN